MNLAAEAEQQHLCLKICIPVLIVYMQERFCFPVILLSRKHSEQLRISDRSFCIGHREHLLKNTMTSVYKFSIFTILILCAMYSSVKARGCYWECGVVCFPCRVWCRLRCPFGKRSTIEKPQNKVPLSFPDKFENYDLDESGGITLEELAKAISVEEHSKETVKAFQLADKDGDGQIECSEFKAAPYLFAHQPSC